jgi:DNA-nicking Smr family endonuclease
MPRRKNPFNDLPPDDAALWNTVSLTVKPLDTVQRDMHVPETARIKRPKPLPAQPDISRAITAAPLQWHGDQSLLRNDKKRVKQGLLKPTICLDLHGYTVSRAEKALTQFLAQAARDGHAWVEIITGHGRPSIYRDADNPDTDKGVLKRLLPEWLNQPVHRIFIKRVIPAPKSRGGAVWVALKTEIGHQ